VLTLVLTLVPALVLVSATQELLVLVLVLMWVRVLATQVWLVPPSVLVSEQQSSHNTRQNTHRHCRG